MSRQRDDAWAAMSIAARALHVTERNSDTRLRTLPPPTTQRAQLTR